MPLPGISAKGRNTIARKGNQNLPLWGRWPEGPDEGLPEGQCDAIASRPHPPLRGPPSPKGRVKNGDKIPLQTFWDSHGPLALGMTALLWGHDRLTAIRKMFHFPAGGRWPAPTVWDGTTL